MILLPVVAIAPPSDRARLRQAAAQSNEYDWIVFTSTNAVSAFATELPEPARMCKARVATIGAATRKAAEVQGFCVSLVPEKHVAEALVEAFAAEDLNGRRILIPSAALTRDVVAPELRKRGARVDVVEAYRNVLPAESAQRGKEIFCEPYPDWVVFTSSSAIDNLVHLIGTDALRHVRIASIGPITSDTVRKHGLEVAAEAAVQSVDGLVEAICRRQGGEAARR